MTIPSLLKLEREREKREVLEMRERAIRLKQVEREKKTASLSICPSAWEPSRGLLLAAERERGSELRKRVLQKPRIKSLECVVFLEREKKK